jgi:hypothetical protein
VFNPKDGLRKLPEVERFAARHSKVDSTVHPHSVHIAHKALSVVAVVPEHPDVLRGKADLDPGTQLTHTGKNSRHHRTYVNWRSGCAALI